MDISVLHGRRILVVEDEYLIGIDLCDSLAMRGAVVMGPLPSVEAAIEMLEQELPPDAAVLDVNLRGGKVYPLAEALSEINVPYIFATGYDSSGIEKSYRNIPRCEKPVHLGDIVDMIEDRLARADRLALTKPNRKD